MKKDLDEINNIIKIIFVFVLIFSIGVSYTITRKLKKDLINISDDLVSGSEQIDATASQLSDSSQTIANGAGNQAASIEQISSSLEELSAQIQNNNASSQEASAVATESSKSAQTGIEVIQKMKTSINMIKESSDETAKIIKTIDEIAFQTNLLALNAAVEAARAGEAGKGFAVVAEEVRNLAQRSADAAQSTSELILESQNNANSGVKVTEEVFHIFSRISGDIEKVKSLINQVSQASNEQSSGIKQLTEGVHQIDQVTQSNAANSEETAASSEELASQSKAFLELVKKLVKLVKG